MSKKKNPTRIKPYDFNDNVYWGPQSCSVGYVLWYLKHGWWPGDDPYLGICIEFICTWIEQHATAVEIIQVVTLLLDWPYNHRGTAWVKEHEGSDLLETLTRVDLGNFDYKTMDKLLCVILRLLAHGAMPPSKSPYLFDQYNLDSGIDRDGSDRDDNDVDDDDGDNDNDGDDDDVDDDDGDNDNDGDDDDVDVDDDDGDNDNDGDDYGSDSDSEFYDFCGHGHLDHILEYTRDDEQSKRWQQHRWVQQMRVLLRLLVQIPNISADTAFSSDALVSLMSNEDVFWYLFDTVLKRNSNVDQFLQTCLDVRHSVNGTHVDQILVVVEHTLYQRRLTAIREELCGKLSNGMIKEVVSYI